MEDDMKGILDDMLKEIVKKKPNEYRSAFGVLVKLLNNIIENPNEPKFRGIKKSNLVVKTKLLIIPEIIDVLNILGFEEGTGEKRRFLFI